MRRRLAVGTLHAFDLTPAMLKRFRDTLDERGVSVDTKQADVLDMDSSPSTWTQLDLIVTASMLEYLPRTRLSDALAALRTRLADDGHAVVFITRRNWLTRPLIGRWWQSTLYNKRELLDAFHRAGFSQVRFSTFPLVCQLPGRLGLRHRRAEVAAGVQRVKWLCDGPQEEHVNIQRIPILIVVALLGAQASAQQVAPKPRPVRALAIPRRDLERRSSRPTRTGHRQNAPTSSSSTTGFCRRRTHRPTRRRRRTRTARSTIT